MTRVAALLLLGALACVSCATPVGVNRADPRTVLRELERSAVTSDLPSAPTRELLTRLSLTRRFAEDPDGTLRELHQQLAPTGDLDRLFALAELSFLHAARTRDRGQVMMAALYAYAFLFGEGRDALDPFDPRIQTARQIHNFALSIGLTSTVRESAPLDLSPVALPIGRLAIDAKPEELRWHGRELVQFAPVIAFRVRGLDNRYRRHGIGAPYAATLGAEIESAPQVQRVPARLRVPVTAFLRIDDVRAQLASGRIHGRLEIYDGDERDAIEIGGERVPIEVERSSSLAYMLEGSPIYDFGLTGFRLGDYLPTGQPDQLLMLQPYRPGRIPLVLVHGTFSSPATWAQMVNELENDPEIARRFQIWLFLYNSGNPIAYSAGVLAETLQEAVAELDPGGSDAALHEMVIAGHSQGGLLTKLMVVHSGTAFWDRIARRPIDEVPLAPDSRALLERSLFYEPLPFVKRVVFLATPHRGSFLADFRVVSWLSRLVQLPVRLTKLTIDLATHGSDEIYLVALDRLPTSLDNMASRNPFLRALAELPIAPGVAANSIIAVRQRGLPKTGDDGVVRYASAHLEDVESELVVRSGHSVQERQEAIQELRRILLEHAAAFQGAGAAGAPAAAGAP